MRRHNWHPKLIEQYLKKHYKNTETRETGRVYLKHFFTTMDQEPDKFLKLSKDDITKILWEYAEKIEDRAKKTQNSMLSFIKKFLVRNRIKIDDVEWEEIRLRNGLNRIRPIIKKKTPTSQDLKKILSYATGIKSRALFTLLASTGMRIDEALSLTWDDIDMNTGMVELPQEITKKDIERYTFFTPEAKELLELWKPEREKMLQTRYKTSVYVRRKLEKLGYEVKREEQAKVHYKNNYQKQFYRWHVYKDGKELTKDEIIALDKRVFPFDYVNANRMWIGLLEKAGKPYNQIDENPKLKDKKYMYNIHSLRRFWFTQLTADRANDEYVNFMGGHSSLLDVDYKTYFDSPVIRRQMKDEYENHIGCLSISESTPDLSGLHSEMAEKDQKIGILEDELNKMKAEITELRLTILEKKNGIK